MSESPTESKLDLILENQAKILNILETQYQSIDKMDQHVNFVQTIYACLRQPLSIFSGKTLPKPMSSVTFKPSTPSSSMTIT
jgi:hypothetical protein